jgi:hypothetical protein
MEPKLTSVITLARSALAQSDSSPWWGVPVLAGAFTVLGAALSQAATLFLARAQTKREDLTRWHADRLKTYSMLLLALDKIHYNLISPSTPTIEPEEVFDAVEPAATTARLVAGPDVDKAISSTVTGLAEVADRGWDGYQSPSMDEIERRFGKLRRLMRAELGVKPSAGGPSSKGDGPPNLKDH